MKRLLFARTDFPVNLDRRIEIPPYHPLMAKNGIDFRSVPNLLDEAVSGMVADLEEVVSKRPDIRYLLKTVARDERSGKILYDAKIKVDGFGIEVDSVPVVGHFWVGRRGINPYNSNGDQGISIDPKIAAKSFNVPEDIKFSIELMNEYEMKDDGVFLRRRSIECPNLWYRHNLGDLTAIFYKNLVIALDNAIVSNLNALDEQSIPVEGR